ncbi:M56 family metallopeptidase [Candidatus Aquicultor sp.]
MALWVFHIKRPSLRRLFLLIPLVKPLIILIGGWKVTGLDTLDWSKLHLPFIFGLQIPDPLNFISNTYDKRFSVQGQVLGRGVTTIEVSVFIIASCAMLALFVRRWMELHRYRTQLTAGSELDHSAFDTVFATVEELSRKLKIKTPGIVFADIQCPAVIGVTNPIIVLPDGLVDMLSGDELEAVIAHELAHIKRKDSIWLWLNIICKEVMFFNPFTRIAFKLISDERERAADYLAVITTDKPIALATSFVKIAETLLKRPQAEPVWSVNRAMVVSKSNLERRVNDLVNFKRYPRLILRIIPLALLFLMLFYVRYFFNIKVSDVTFFSFFG